MLATAIRTERQNRSPITMAGYRKGERPGNYGLKLPAEPLTRDEIERLLRHLGRGPCGHRNRALVVLLWRSGLRIAEALALYPKDIDPAAGTVTVLSGKGSRRRQVAVDGYSLAALERWQAARAELGLTGRHPLFCCVDVRTRGKAMYSSYVRDMLKHRARQAGIEKRVHPHGLRHTMAFELLMEGQPLGVIRDQLGHSELATTMRYLDHLAPAAAIRAMHARPAPAFGVDEPQPPHGEL
jgi:site-specific recombinase XerD